MKLLLILILALKQSFIKCINGKYKQINIKNRTYYFFSVWSILNLLKIDKKLYKNIDIYYIGYITIKSICDYESINNFNSLYFNVSEINEFIEEKSGKKYLVFDSTDDENKEVLTN